MKELLVAFICITFIGCNGNAQEKKKPFPIQKTDSEWKAELSAAEYNILREEGTERAFSSDLLRIKEKGTYVCAACENVLFTSDTKYESHCGWPSFDQAVPGYVIYEKDTSFGMIRTEVMCAKCGGHLGHVFDDGPRETTGQRYCTNSVSIKFIPNK